VSGAAGARPATPADPPADPPAGAAARSAAGTHVDTVLAALAADPGREALVHRGRRFTAGDLHERVLRTAHALRGRGLGHGDCLALLSRSRPEVFTVRYAAQLLGCHVDHLSLDVSARAVAAALAGTGARALAVDPALAGRAADALALPGPGAARGRRSGGPGPEVYLLGPDGTRDGPAADRSVPDRPELRHALELPGLVARADTSPLRCPAAPGDPCAIYHTGGTTGLPKGICRTYAQIGAIVTGPLPHGLGELPGTDRLLVCTTLSMFGGFLADRALAHGVPVVLHEDFDAAAVLAAIEEERVTRLYLPPPLLYAVADHPALAGRDTSSLRTVFYGGCPSSPARIADVLRRLGPVLVQHYGQNEAGSISVLPAADHDPDRPGPLATVGTPLPGVRIEIRDPAGRVLPDGGTGEIWVRSPGVMDGYRHDPALTAGTLADGWLRTGDLGRLGADGRLTLAGRLRDIVFAGTANVYCTEIEETLNSHPAVLQSAVFGVPAVGGGGTERPAAEPEADAGPEGISGPNGPDGTGGGPGYGDDDGPEEIHAVVVPVPGRVPAVGELRDWVRREQSSHYELARITFTGALPLTGAGKPDKRRLRREARRTAPPALPSAVAAPAPAPPV
jgi:fatty-acyl-CoA synthase